MVTLLLIQNLIGEHDARLLFIRHIIPGHKVEMSNGQGAVCPSLVMQFPRGQISRKNALA